MELTAGRISELLAKDAERVCRELLPAGRNRSSEWTVGSTGGDEGDSLRVRLTGDKAGVWSDFATGEAGDLIDLWAAVRGCDLGTAIREAKSWLGVADADVRPQREREYKPPQIPRCTEVEGEALRWLTEERGLSEGTLREFRVACAGPRVLFPFLSPQGERVMVKFRSITDKTTAPTSADQRPSLFGWQAVPPKVRHITLTEGEIDAMSLAELGIPALSVPFGGGGGNKQAWVEHEYENLARFDVIYLALDNDAPGREAAAEIAKRLGPERCRMVELPAKDANDCLRQGLDLQAAFRTAKSMDPDGLVTASALKDDVMALMYPDPDAPANHIETPWNIHEDLVFRWGELVVAAGINGHGKTSLVNQCALAAIRQGERVMVASLEYRPERFLRKMVIQGAGLANEYPARPYAEAVTEWMGDRLLLWGKTGSQKLEELIEVMRYSAKRYGVRVFVVDSMTKLGLGEEDYDGQKRAVEALADFKNDFNAVVLLVCHVRKGASEDQVFDKTDVKGTGAVTDLADTVLLVRRNKVKEREADKAKHGREHKAEALAEPDTYLSIGKQRNGGNEVTKGLWFVRGCEQFVRAEDQKPWRYVNWSAAQMEQVA